MSKIAFSSSLAQNTTFNHTNKTITVSAKFFRAAKDPTTNEFSDLMMMREICPGYEIITRTHRSPRKTEKSKNIKKFVSYDKMEKYIKLLPDSEKLLDQLKTVKAYADAHNYAASIVFNWFNETFPDHRYAPKIDDNGKLFARVNVVNIEDYKKSLEAKERAREEAKKKAELPQASDPQDTDTLQEVV